MGKFCSPLRGSLIRKCVLLCVQCCGQSAEDAAPGSGSSGAAEEGSAGQRHGDVSRNLPDCCGTWGNSLQVLRLQRGEK